MKAISCFRRCLVLLLFALVTVISEPSSSEKIDVPKCENEMKCFAPSKCDDTTGTELNSMKRVTRTCPAVLKIRAYSHNFWLVELQSFDVNVKTISLTVNNVVFLSCGTDNSDIVATYGESEMKLLSHSKEDAPLMCEFYVKEDDEKPILISDTNNPKILRMNVDDGPVLSQQEIQMYLVKPTCDPTFIKKEINQHYGAEFTVPVNGKTSNVICPEGFALQYMTNKYSTVDSTICGTENNGLSYEYVITSNKKVVERLRQPTEFQARCAAPTCAQCNYIPDSTPVDSMTIVDAGSCKELKCKEGRLMLERDSGVTKCEYRKGAHVWMLDERPIEQSTHVECRQTLSCKKWNILISQCEQGPADSRCFVAADNLPHCSNDKLHVDGRISNVTCNIDDVEYYVNGSVLLSTEAKLDCGNSPAGMAAILSGCREKRRKALSAVATCRVIFYILLAVVLLLLLANVGVVFARKFSKNELTNQKHQGIAIAPDLKTAKETPEDWKRSKQCTEKKLPIVADPIALVSRPEVENAVKSQEKASKKKENEEKSKSKEKSTHSQTRLELGEKPLNIRSSDFNYSGPVKCLTRSHGPQIHKYENDNRNPQPSAIVFDPALNDAVGIGPGVDIYESGGPSSESNRSTIFPVPEENKKKNPVDTRTETSKKSNKQQSNVDDTQPDKTIPKARNE